MLSNSLTFECRNPQELAAEEHTAETEEYGISSVMFVEDEAPFHPVRLAQIMRGFGDYEDAVRLGKSDDGAEEEVSGSSFPDVFKGVVRTKGHIWLANANAFPISFQSAGAHIDMRPSENPFLWEVERKLNKKEKEIEEKKGDGSDDGSDDAMILGTPITDDFKRMVRSQVQLHKEQGLWTKDHGDKRTQLIFIGIGLDKELIESKLKAALVTKAEGSIKSWKKCVSPVLISCLSRSFLFFSLTCSGCTILSTEARSLLTLTYDHTFRYYIGQRGYILRT